MQVLVIQEILACEQKYYTKRLIIRPKTNREPVIRLHLKAYPAKYVGQPSAG